MKDQKRKGELKINMDTQVLIKSASPNELSPQQSPRDNISVLSKGSLNTKKNSYDHDNINNKITKGDDNIINLINEVIIEDLNEKSTISS